VLWFARHDSAQNICARANCTDEHACVCECALGPLRMQQRARGGRVRAGARARFVDF